MERLYVVYATNDLGQDDVYIVKVNNKKEAVDLIYDSGDYLKKNLKVKDLEVDLFKHSGFNRKVVMII